MPGSEHAKFRFTEENRILVNGVTLQVALDDACQTIALRCRRTDIAHLMDSGVSALSEIAAECSDDYICYELNKDQRPKLGDGVLTTIFTEVAEKYNHPPKPAVEDDDEDKLTEEADDARYTAGITPIKRRLIFLAKHWELATLPSCLLPTMDTPEHVQQLHAYLRGDNTTLIRYKEPRALQDLEQYGYALEFEALCGALLAALKQCIIEAVATTFPKKHKFDKNDPIHDIVTFRDRAWQFNEDALTEAAEEKYEHSEVLHRDAAALLEITEESSAADLIANSKSRKATALFKMFYTLYYYAVEKNNEIFVHLKSKYEEHVLPQLERLEAFNTKPEERESNVFVRDNLDEKLAKKRPALAWGEKAAQLGALKPIDTNVQALTELAGKYALSDGKKKAAHGFVARGFIECFILHEQDRRLVARTRAQLQAKKADGTYPCKVLEFDERNQPTSVDQDKAQGKFISQLLDIRFIERAPEECMHIRAKMVDQEKFRVFLLLDAQTLSFYYVELGGKKSYFVTQKTGDVDTADSEVRNYTYTDLIEMIKTNVQPKAAGFSLRSCYSVPPTLFVERLEAGQFATTTFTKLATIDSNSELREEEAKVRRMKEVLDAALSLGTWRPRVKSRTDETTRTYEAIRDYCVRLAP